MSSQPLLSVVVPAFNEEDNIGPLVREVEAALAGLAGGFELIIVDDGSTDASCGRCEELMERCSWLRVVALSRNAGQSAAFHAGIRAARGELVGMLDADLQNDPADLPRLIAAMREQGADWAQGVRRNRRDSNSLSRKFSSWVGRTFRRKLLGDTIRDTGCSCRVFRREVGLSLPLQFRGMHRFMPVYVRRLGFVVIEHDVSHRPRHAGTAKYGMWNRALPGLRDLFATRWMFNRMRPVEFREVERRRDEARKEFAASRPSAPVEAGRV